MKTKFLIFLTAILLLSTNAILAQNEAITLESVVGLHGTSSDSIIADGNTQIVFNLRVTASGTVVHGGITNGFRVYSDDGATWTATTADTLVPGWDAWFDLIYAINLYSPDGILTDTIGFGGSRLFGAGLPATFDEVAYSITIGPIDVMHTGKMICLDSSFYGQTGVWKWLGPTAATSFFPAWSGPHCFRVIDPTTLGITPIGNGSLPTSFAMTQNYPNPFNPRTEIKFDIPTRADVKLVVYNVLGQQVATLIDRSMEAGSYIVDWDGVSDDNKHISSGIYFYRIEANDFVETKKMLMLK